MTAKIHVGEGWDIHRLEPGDGVIIAGIRVACEYRAIGHSDGDVALHALTDALLGAAGLDDIGYHFPPSDNRWKDVSSRKFLQRACDLLDDGGWTVANVDLTVIFQAVKLNPYRAKMKQLIEKIIPGNPLVNVKFKTAEKLGAVGENKAVEARSVVLIKN
ncbi:MAG: 2-C-methyl-D-erythritol 2,4-cyclodiphosphate synthase [bacterium]